MFLEAMYSVLPAPSTSHYATYSMSLLYIKAQGFLITLCWSSSEQLFILSEVPIDTTKLKVAYMYYNSASSAETGQNSIHAWLTLVHKLRYQPSKLLMIVLWRQGGLHTNSVSGVIPLSTLTVLMAESSIFFPFHSRWKEINLHNLWLP